jgi:hypothetical protein
VNGDWCVDDVVRRITDGAHAAVLSVPDEHGVAVVRFGVQGSQSCAFGVRKISKVLACEFERVTVGEFTV